MKVKEMLQQQRVNVRLVGEDERTVEETGNATCEGGAAELRNPIVRGNARTSKLALGLCRLQGI